MTCTRTCHRDKPRRGFDEERGRDAYRRGTSERRRRAGTRRDREAKLLKRFFCCFFLHRGVGAARANESSRAHQYPVRLPPRPTISPTQNQAYTSAVKRAAVPTYARGGAGGGSIFESVASVANRESPRCEVPVRETARDRTVPRSRGGWERVGAISRGGRGSRRGGGAHLGHGKLHAVRPLLLNHLHLALRGLDHAGKPVDRGVRGWV